MDFHVSNGKGMPSLVDSGSSDILVPNSLFDLFIAALNRPEVNLNCTPTGPDIMNATYCKCPQDAVAVPGFVPDPSAPLTSDLPMLSVAIMSEVVSGDVSGSRDEHVC